MGIGDRHFALLGVDPLFLSMKGVPGEVVEDAKAFLASKGVFHAASVRASSASGDDGVDRRGMGGDQDYAKR
jgi:hypothetical protein